MIYYSLLIQYVTPSYLIHTGTKMLSSNEQILGVHQIIVFKVPRRLSMSLNLKTISVGWERGFWGIVYTNVDWYKAAIFNYRRIAYLSQGSLSRLVKFFWNRHSQWSLSHSLTTFIIPKGVQSYIISLCFVDHVTWSMLIPNLNKKVQSVTLTHNPTMLPNKN